MQEWKMWREVYNNLVTDHTDAKHKHAFVESASVVNDAIDYVSQQGTVGRYPGKSRIVSIIYATCISQTYGEDFFRVLDDPELFQNPDDWFTPYSEDKENYDAILARLKDIPDWIKGGWAPKTVEYFHLECTEAGVNSIT